MRWPWEQSEREAKRRQQVVDHADKQNGRVQEAQSLIDDTRDHSDEELKRAHDILGDVRKSERMLVKMYDDAEQERKGS